MNINIDWQPAVGDPSVVGWVTVLGYFVTAAICWLASATAETRANQWQPWTKRERRFWSFVAVLFTFLGFNKQLDLQSLLTQIGRYYAYSGGWYHLRQTIQLLFIICLTGVALLVAFTLFWLSRHLAIEILVASASLCVLGAYIFIRAATFHLAGGFLGENVMVLRSAAALELGSIIFVAAAGFLYQRKTPDR